MFNRRKTQKMFQTGTATGRIILLFPILISILLSGCGEDKNIEHSRIVFKSLKEESVRLYSRLHPLRSSRLGLAGVDSLLFTFSEEELSFFTEKIDSVLNVFAELPAAHLNGEELDDSALIISWLRGESFNLNRLCNHKHNPLLYCWLLDETLFAIPSRLDKPGEKEFEDYGKRLARIPLLLENASYNLKNPAELHVNTAAERITALITAFTELDTLVLERYGRLPSSLGTAKQSIIFFKDLLVNEITPRAHGRHILGMENLSDLFRYSEHLDIDLDRFITETKKTIRKYRSQISSIEKNSTHTHFSAREQGTAAKAGSSDSLITAGSAGTGSDVSSILSDIEERISQQGVFNIRKRHHPDILRIDNPGLSEVLPVNPYLVVPGSRKHRLVSFSFRAVGEKKCDLTIIIRPDAENTEKDRLFYELMKVSSPVTRARYMLCKDGSDIRKIFASEFFMTGWSILNLKDLFILHPDKKLELRKFLLEDKILELARMLIVLQLHSGRSTIDFCVDFLINDMGLQREDALSEVAIASSSPSLAFPGIAMTLTDDLIRKASSVRGEKNPRKKIQKLMIDNLALPLLMIAERIED